MKDPRIEHAIGVCKKAVAAFFYRLTTNTATLWIINSWTWPHSWTPGSGQLTLTQTRWNRQSQQLSDSSLLDLEESCHWAAGSACWQNYTRGAWSSCESTNFWAWAQEENDFRDLLQEECTSATFPPQVRGSQNRDWAGSLPALPWGRPRYWSTSVVEAPWTKLPKDYQAGQEVPLYPCYKCPVREGFQCGGWDCYMQQGMPEARGSGQACLPCKKFVKMLKLTTASMHTMSKCVLYKTGTFYLSTKKYFMKDMFCTLSIPMGKLICFVTACNPMFNVCLQKHIDKSECLQKHMLT